MKANRNLLCQINQLESGKGLDNLLSIAAGVVACLKMLWKLIKIIFFLCCAFNASVVLFIMGFKLYMPKAEFVVPLKFVHEQTHIYSPLSLLPYSKYLTKHSTKYTIWLHLIIPDNPSNNSIGNFMATLQSTQSAGGVIGSSSMIMNYESKIVKTCKCVAKLPLYLCGLSREQQHLSANIVHHRKISPSDYVLIISNPTLQIYSGWIQFEAKLSMLQYVYHRYFIPSAFLSIWIIFVYLAISSTLLSLVYNWKYSNNLNRLASAELEDEDSYFLQSLYNSQPFSQ